jgi:hypothetical protein
MRSWPGWAIRGAASFERGRVKGIHRCRVRRAQADVNTAIFGHAPHRLALVDPEFGILLAEAEFAINVEDCAGGAP